MMRRRGGNSTKRLGFKAYVEEDRGHDTPCWIFTGMRDRKGYGKMRIPGKNQTGAHRAFYTHYVGEIPDGLTIDHLCRVRDCVNPDHLEPVTRGENVLRGNTLAARNAARTHCRRGHEYDRIYSGSRCCSRCMAYTGKMLRVRKKALQ